MGLDFTAEMGCSLKSGQLHPQNRSLSWDSTYNTVLMQGWVRCSGGAGGGGVTGVLWVRVPAM